MGEYKYSEQEKQLNRILAYQHQQLDGIKFDTTAIDNAISESEKVLRSLGYSGEVGKAKFSAKICDSNSTRDLIIPSWGQLCQDANRTISGNVELEQLFTPGELLSNKAEITKLNDDFDSIHKLDNMDVAICAVAGILSAALDIMMVGIPGPSPTGISGGTLSNYIRQLFEKKFPPEEMEKLAGKKFVKTPYDAQDNRHTRIHVEGLSSYYHRLLQFGHDPLLGWIVGTLDIMNGTMTTIDKNGKIVVQAISEYADRKEPKLYRALLKQFLHLKSDLMTSMGLPAPLMELFNLMQFGSIGEEEQTVAEIVQGMYYQGYDFIQFCSSSIPVMTTEVIVRTAWSIKRIKNGCSIKEAIPVSLSRQKNPKLATMLFVAHSAAAAINAGKVYFSHNPLAINYPQWLAFARYSFKQLKWNIYQKPDLRHKYVMGIIDKERCDILQMIDEEFDKFQKGLLIDSQILIM
ncbi:MAG: hypothetical protein MJZ67_03015 [Bacteroidales bacterium]|nr:hypothetical protein [Bacteroidales bacterium]